MKRSHLNLSDVESPPIRKIRNVGEEEIEDKSKLWSDEEEEEEEENEVSDNEYGSSEGEEYSDEELESEKKLSTPESLKDLNSNEEGKYIAEADTENGLTEIKDINGNNSSIARRLPNLIPEQGMPEWAKTYFRVKARPRRYGIYLEDDMDLPVGMSRVDKPKDMEVSESRDTVTGFAGYRTARASHGVYQGCWYFEVTIEHLGKEGAARVGWATIRCETSGPVGCCNYGYSYRNVGGTKQHLSLREPYGQEYKEGDVIGCVICLPEGGRRMEKIIKDVVKKFDTFYFLDETGPDPETLKGSFVLFTKNGISQGIAYKSLSEGTYYPAISLFCTPTQIEGVTVKTNFGPNFVCNIESTSLCESDVKVRPMSEAICESSAEERIFDVIQYCDFT